MNRLLSKEETQEVLVSMLDDIVDYLNRHGLRYYLVGGTLLGAIRHQGFIPWDDDIDIGMPRADYERFLELVRKEPIADNLKVISDRHGTFSNPFTEVLNTDTYLERKTEEYISKKYIVKNLFIDIIPQDGWPSDEGEAEKLYEKMSRYRYLVQCSRAILGHGTTPVRTLMKAPIIIISKIYGNKRLLRKMDDLAKSCSYDESDYVGAVTYGIYGVGERCVRAETVKFTKVLFEGKEYNAPGCWDKYLSNIYGDYMKLPPKEKQVDHRMKVWLLDKGK